MRKCNGRKRSQFLPWITSRALAQFPMLRFLALPACPQQSPADRTARFYAKFTCQF
jgi:hypothetical protein